MLVSIQHLAAHKWPATWVRDNMHRPLVQLSGNLCLALSHHGSGEWLYLKGNYYWGDSFLTSMIMRGRVEVLIETWFRPLSLRLLAMVIQVDLATAMDRTWSVEKVVWVGEGPVELYGKAWLLPFMHMFIAHRGNPHHALNHRHAQVRFIRTRKQRSGVHKKFSIAKSSLPSCSCQKQ